MSCGYRNTISMKSIRLQGYDYANRGEYFVTICPRKRMCLLGDIVEGEMRLSEMGRIVDACWREIPSHFENTRVDVFQIMPNHVHGIVELLEKPKQQNLVGARHAVPVQKFDGEKFGKPRPGSLSTIIRSFKAAVTKEVHKLNLFLEESIWQSRFYDHIIRNDKDYFFVEQYIKLNPLLWYLDTDNPDVRAMPPDELRRTLQEKHNLIGYALERMIERELNYRDWWEKEITIAE